MILWRTVDPKALNPVFRADVEALLGGSPYTWVVTYGYRTLAEQKALWEKHLKGGPRAAPPGKSAHNYGLAIDVALDGDPAPGLQPEWNTAHEGWRWLFEAVFAHPRIHSGRDFGDACHIERLGWKQFIQEAA